MKKIYFDNGSTSFPKAPNVANVVSDILTHGSYNINRGGYEASYSLSDNILNTRERLCELFGFNKPRNVVFTNNITTSLNMIIKGFLKSSDHVVVSSMEHNAVMRPIVQVKEQGVNYSVAQGEKDGTVSPQAVEKAITKDTKAVIMLHGSNVCGTVNDLEEIGKICKKHKVFFICDCAQTAGVIPINMEKMNIDCLCFTGHKGLLAPQGTGGFIIKSELEKLINPLIAGGTGSISDSLEMPHTMPDKFESGTMNLPGILGLREALIYIKDRTTEDILAHEMAITKEFLEGAKTLKNTKIIGKTNLDNRTAVVSLDFENIDNAMVSYELDETYGIMTRCGMHCAPEAHKTLGTFPQGTVRFSFGYSSNIDDVHFCIDSLKKIIG